MKQLITASLLASAVLFGTVSAVAATEVEKDKKEDGKMMMDKKKDEEKNEKAASN